MRESDWMREADQMREAEQIRERPIDERGGLNEREAYWMGGCRLDEKRWIGWGEADCMRERRIG